MTGPESSFVEALRDLQAALNELRVPWLVIGGLAVIARGVPRFTADVDATFVGDDVALEKVFEVLGRRGEDRDYAGVVLPVAQADDLVIYKFVAFRPRDLDDAERLLLLHGARLDVRRIVETVKEFATALDDTERVDMLQRLLRRAGIDP